jgi:excisionase family DNA binding protein
MYTVKEIADLLGTSKPTVQKVINENFIEYDRIEKNKFRYYSYEKTIFIIRIIKPDFNFSNLPKKTEKLLKNIEKPPSEPQEILETTEKPPSDEALNRMLAIIEQQLAEKNKMLAQKDKELQDLREQSERERADLQNKLAAAYSQISEMAQKAQYITAADKTVQIMDKQKKEDVAAAEGLDPNIVDPDHTDHGTSPAAAGEFNKEAAIDPPKKSFFARIFGK